MDFRTTILPHRDRLYRLALSMTLDAAEAQDVVQDTMMRAWERRAEWPSIQNMQAWLIQICKNLLLDRKKRQRFEVRNFYDSADGESAPPTSQASTSPNTDVVEARDSLSLLQRLISQLPSPMGDLIFLRDIEGQSYREIAAQLSLTEDQVRVYLHRARTQLRQRYAAIQGFGL